MALASPAAAPGAVPFEHGMYLARKIEHRMLQVLPIQLKLVERFYRQHNPSLDVRGFQEDLEYDLQLLQEVSVRGSKHGVGLRLGDRPLFHTLLVQLQRLTSKLRELAAMLLPSMSHELRAWSGNEGLPQGHGNMFLSAVLRASGQSVSSPASPVDYSTPMASMPPSAAASTSGRVPQPAAAAAVSARRPGSGSDEGVKRQNGLLEELRRTIAVADRLLGMPEAAAEPPVPQLEAAPAGGSRRRRSSATSHSSATSPSASPPADPFAFLDHFGNGAFSAPSSPPTAAPTNHSDHYQQQQQQQQQQFQEDEAGDDSDARAGEDDDGYESRSRDSYDDGSAQPLFAATATTVAAAAAAAAIAAQEGGDNRSMPQQRQPQHFPQPSLGLGESAGPVRPLNIPLPPPREGGNGVRAVSPYVEESDRPFYSAASHASSGGFEANSRGSLQGLREATSGRSQPYAASSQPSGSQDGDEEGALLAHLRTLVGAMEDSIKSRHDVKQVSDILSHYSATDESRAFASAEPSFIRRGDKEYSRLADGSTGFAANDPYIKAYYDARQQYQRPQHSLPSGMLPADLSQSQSWSSGDASASASDASHSPPPQRSSRRGRPVSSRSYTQAVSRRPRRGAVEAGGGRRKGLGN